MTHSHSRSAGATVLAAALTAGILVTLVGGAAAAASPVPLGNASRFAVLAGSGITNTGPTTITGDFDSYPTTTVTGIGSITGSGTYHDGDAVTQQAKKDLVTAYNTVLGEGPSSPITADLGGENVSPGVYESASSIGLTGTLILDAHGNTNAVFIFRADSTLTTASASQVMLVNGARACHVFWLVGRYATLGTGSTFRGTILARGSITVGNGAGVYGRVLSRNGAVTLNTNTIHRPTCAQGQEKGHTTARPFSRHVGIGLTG